MERLTPRDMDILEFAGRQTSIRPEHVEDRFGVSRATAYRRLRWLDELGLVAHFDRVSTKGQVFAATRKGLTTANLPLPPAEPNAWTLRHEEAMTAVVCDLESQNVDCLTERQLIAHNRFARNDRYTFELREARNNRRVGHRPDIVCEIPDVDKFVAIEVELSPKNVSRWRDSLSAFSSRVNVDGFIGVLYVADSAARPSRIEELAREAGLGRRFQLRSTSDPDLLGGLIAIMKADRRRAERSAA
jgi:hypothetical protein